MSRQKGRSSRKRLRAVQQVQVYSAAGQPKVKESLVQRAEKGLASSACRDLYLSKYRKDLSLSAVSLTAEGAWHYLNRNLPEARLFGLEEELRLLAQQAARRFLGRPTKTVQAKPD